MLHAKSLPKPDSSGFWGHLEELRKRILVSFWAFLFFFGLAWLISSRLLNFLMEPLRGSGTLLYFQKPYEAFTIRVSLSAWCGFFLCLPVIFHQAWMFMRPGLYTKEKQRLLGWLGAGSALAVGGGMLGYQILAPWMLQFFLSYQTEALRPLLTIDSYAAFLMALLVGLGLVFELPIVLLALIQWGVVSTEQLKKSRKTAVIVILVMAAILTPTQDPMTQLTAAAPCFLLFETVVIVGRFFEAGHKRDKV